ncbi:MAG TPA: serine hydrolase [Clostridiales bacterium]|nr:serine hydrolase [Clostridiales bacterium]
MKVNLFTKAQPEHMGISSKHIIRFLKKAEANGVMLHSILMMRRGNIVAEGYYAPFTQNELHRVYSVSKTFTSTAIGLLADEGRISLDDHVCDYFQDKLPETPHPYILDMRIRDLLIMATPHTVPTYKPDDKDWAWTFFNTEPSHPPGTIFSYDTSGTYVLDVLIERVTGKPFLEYLKDKVLRELGFSENAWCIKAPEGHSWGGSGVMCTTRDLAILAVLYMNNGNIGGRQYISEEYVKAATSRQIDNAPTGHRDYLHGNGYGYQIWMLKDGAYAFVGMGMQLVICVPREDFIFICTGDTQGSAQVYAGIFELLWSEIIEHLQPGSLPEDETSARQLEELLCSLKVVNPIIGQSSSPFAEKINRRLYALNSNPMGLEKIGIILNDNTGQLVYVTKEGEKHISFGLENYVQGLFPQTNYYGDTIGTPGGRMYKCMAAARWTEENKLVIRCYIIDCYLGNLTVTLSYKGDEIGVCMTKTAEWFLDEYEGFAGGRIIANESLKL